MPKPRTIALEFLKLPHHERIRIALVLKVIKLKERDIPDTLLFPLIFERVRERSLVDELWKEIVHASSELCERCKGSGYDHIPAEGGGENVCNECFGHGRLNLDLD